MLKAARAKPRSHHLPVLPPCTRTQWTLLLKASTALFETNYNDALWDDCLCRLTMHNVRYSTVTRNAPSGLSGPKRSEPI